MLNDRVVAYLSLIFGVVGFGFAVYQSHEVKKLNEYVRANNWFNYQRMENENGTVQIAKQRYLKLYRDTINPELLNLLAMADAHGQELTKEAIRQIQISEPSFTITDFKRWEQEGKLGPDKIELFKRFAINANIPTD
ncbi:hypothetical protein [Pseudoalteromonas piscicida]|uniref:hypothetical protein n=1 Tax=Pseudoalteromonas piscicida TaxID=43662 RepID=UPI001C97F10D|nr:hypothetical protein [Pseudoalteromonas piscicida]QZO12234.1 hypothetical protein K5642_14130 [Pseudoalteromonas piscicida]